MNRTLAMASLTVALVWLGVRSFSKDKVSPQPDPILVVATSRVMSPGYRRLTQTMLQAREVDLAHPRRGCFRSPCHRGRMRPPGRKDAKCHVRSSCL